MNYKYQVALSFASEDRQHAERLAQLLEEKNITVFYDFYEKANLWGKDLYQHLNDVYKNQAKFCVIFLSQNYTKKLWTQHELMAAQTRAFKGKEEYILPLKVDSTNVPDIINDTRGYLDLQQTSLEEVARILEVKLRESISDAETYIPVSIVQEKVESSRLELSKSEELRSALLQVLTGRFSRVELRSFCFELLGSIALEQLPKKQPDISIELISHFERRNQLEHLASFIKKKRSDIEF